MSKAYERFDELREYAAEVAIGIVIAEQLERIADALEKQSAGHIQIEGKSISTDETGKVYSQGSTQKWTP